MPVPLQRGEPTSIADTRSLCPNGRVVLVDWRGRSDDPLNGEAAARRFVAPSRRSLRPLRRARRAGYRLDLLAPAGRNRCRNSSVTWATLSS